MTPRISDLFTVSGNTLLSRLLGFVRDLVIARIFGADLATDAFFVAFKVPNFLRRLFAEGAFASAFVPLLTEYKATGSESELKGFVDRVFGTLALVLLVVSVIGVVLAPLVVLLFAPGWFFGAETGYELAVDMLRLTFPYLLFISLTAFAGGILNAHKRFGVPAFTPVLLNLSLIACALWLSGYMDTQVFALAWGVLVAGVAQFAFQLPFLWRLRMLPRFRPAPRDPGVRRLLGLMGPALLGVSVAQINLLLDTLLASFLVSGSISWLYYSDRLLEFPVGILGVALGTVILPHLSERNASQDRAAISQTLGWGLRWVLLLGLPASVGLAVLAEPIMSTLFLSDAFDAHDAAMSARSLAAYSLGLVPFLAIKVLVPGFHSRQDMKTPVRIAIVALAVNLVLNLLLIGPMAHAGLALATSAAALVNALLLWLSLLRDGYKLNFDRWAGLGLRAALSCLVLASALWWASGYWGPWVEAGQWERVWRLGLLVLGGAGLYFLLLAVFGVRKRDFQGA